MPATAKVDYSTDPATIEIPRDYNAAVEFIDVHASAGRSGKTAFIDDAGAYTYAELAQRVNRAGNALQALGAELETRVMLCMLDTVDMSAVFWGVIKAGAVAIPVNTLLTPQDYEYIVKDSRARILVVSAALYDTLAPVIAEAPHLKEIVIAGGSRDGHQSLEDLMASAGDTLMPADTTADDVAFWLYTSGSTGTPKGSMHLHSDLVCTAVHYGKGVLGIREDDVVFSAAKMFFAYGLGNTLTFPLYVGATAAVIAGRPTPDSVLGALQKHQASIFYGVPTLYAAILADEKNDRERVSQRLRLCVSAGEALPGDVGTRWQEKFGAEIIDGLGSTEMLHIFLSNVPGDVHYGTSGRAVPGYRLRVVDEDDQPVAPGEIGELLVDGRSAAVAYWNQRDKSLHTFMGRWTRTGDKYTVSEDGLYTYCGRTDDMLKVSGNWVSPFEVESALIAHDKVLEVGVVGAQDEAGLIKPKAFVVLHEPGDAGAATATELQAFVKQSLAPYKYPRWIEFVDALPKTATGKVQRFKLRARSPD
ncbi:MAG: benzoate-CoA ligase family protein [Gammaproteobacteria bacterium]|nr:benzoate-CoA ligase family protein [Gammaproteobacteria bacterium]